MSPERKGFFLPGLLMTGAAGVVILALSLFYAVFHAPIGRGGEAVTVRIASGSNLAAIGTTLAGTGAISHPRLFLWTARLAGMERKLRSGDYEIDPSWNLPELLDTLAAGRSRLLSVTLPEGIGMIEVANRLETAGITDGEAFLQLAAEPAFLEALGVPGDTAEGFLFPETYLFAASSRPGDVLTAMVRQFQAVYEKVRATGSAGDLDLLEVVTLASIVERETALPEERPLVAAVFLNRLRRKNRLQSDPTVIYGIEDFDGNITRRHLETPTPYNTYVIRGLPPGPIANPGRDSLRAVFNPAPVDYLYFVSRNDGSHQFSRSLKEHNRAVRKHQLARRKR